MFISLLWEGWRGLMGEIGSASVCDVGGMRKNIFLQPAHCNGSGLCFPGKLISWEIARA